MKDIYQVNAYSVHSSKDDIEQHFLNPQEIQRQTNQFNTDLNLNHQIPLFDQQMKALDSKRLEDALIELSPNDSQIQIESEDFFRDQESTERHYFNIFQDDDQTILNQQILTEELRTQKIDFEGGFHFSSDQNKFIEKKVLSNQYDPVVIEETKNSQIKHNLRNEQGKSIPNNIRSTINTMIKKHFLKKKFDDFMKNNDMKGNCQLVIICFYLFLLEQNVQMSLAKSYLDQLHNYLKKRKVQAEQKINRETGEYVKIKCQLQLITYLVSLNFERQELKLNELCQISQPLYKGRQKRTNFKQFGKFEKIYEEIISDSQEEVIRSCSISSKAGYDIYS